jgi:maltokinase
VPAADLLTLGEVHAIRVVPTDDGPRAAPFVRRDGEWRRATAGDGAAVALVGRLYDADAATPAQFRVSAPEKPPVTLDADDERAMGVDQTHESWVVGGQVVVKWMTEPLVGPHPAADRLRRLAAAGFAESPALWGLVEWRDPDTGHWVPLAVAQSYLPRTEDGWTWAVTEARRALRVETGPAQDFAADLGEVVGRLHLALADDPPARLTPALARQHADEALAALDLAVRLTEPHDPDSYDLLIRHRSRIEGVLAGLADAAGAVVLPVHGDLHVGQVLRGPDGYAVVDFDGNPTRSPALRAEDAPVAMDVAGMLISLENVSHVARHGAPPTVDPAESAALDWTALAWTGHAQGLFLSGYRRALGDHTDLFDPALVPAYSWEQLCREFVYAAQHLPEWLYVPAASLRRRVEQS